MAIKLEGAGIGDTQWWNFIWAQSLNFQFLVYLGRIKIFFEKNTPIPPPHFHLKKISRYFLGVFRKITQMVP